MEDVTVSADAWSPKGKLVSDYPIMPPSISLYASVNFYYIMLSFNHVPFLNSMIMSHYYITLYPLVYSIIGLSINYTSHAIDDNHINQFSSDEPLSLPLSHLIILK